MKNTYLELQNSRQKSYEEIKKLEMDLLGHKEEKQNFKEKISELSKENDLLKNDMRVLEKEMYFLINCIHKNKKIGVLAKKKTRKTKISRKHWTKESLISLKKSKT